MDGMFSDRFEAGSRLAEALGTYRGGDAIVLGLARGGVEIGYAVADALDLPLQALIVRKLGAPQNPELAIGAVSETGDRWLDPHLVEMTGASRSYIERETQTQLAEARRRKGAYGGLAPETVHRKPAIVVDDGIATGATALVAVRSARDLHAAKVVLATPVASPQAVSFLRPSVDELVVLQVPDPFLAVGMHYRSFNQVTDEEVMELLRRANEHATGKGSREVEIPCGDVRLSATLTVPRGARGVVAFAHGSGSGRYSPRNRTVAQTLQEAGLATLLADLLTEDEAQDRGKVFDITLLAQRLESCTEFLGQDAETRRLPAGYFGASTGAGAALVAAADAGTRIKAVVSRGGRPDLAEERLEQVQSPTLLIVGGEDRPVIELNHAAYMRLRCTKDLVVVPGATHLFEEPGALEEVARLARDWFSRYLTG